MVLEVLAPEYYPLPVIAIAEVLGIPSEDRDMFRAWSKIVVGTAGVGIGPRPSDERMADRKRARDEMAAYFTEMAQARRKDPREDLLSGLVHAEVEGHRLDFEEMLEMRYDSPIQADPRRASREVELRGVKIPADATVFSWLGSANRDERVFERPEEFLVDRDPNRHISFGFGQHYCLGANLARLETRVALRRLLARTSDIQLTNREPLPLHPSFIFRGPQALPVLLKAA